MSKSAGGIGFPGVLTIVFVVLKATGNIDWSWWLVFSPLWIAALIGMVLMLIFAIVTANR